MSTASLAAAGLRGHARRLIATAAAIALSVAFVASVMLGLDAMERGAQESVAGDVVNRDLVLWASGNLVGQQVEGLRAVGGLEVVEARAEVYGTVDGMGTLATTAPRGPGVALLEGRMPSASPEAVAASATNYAVGDTVAFERYDPEGNLLDPVDLTVVGIMDVGGSPQFTWSDVLVVPESTLTGWDSQQPFSLVTLDLTGADEAGARAAVESIAPGTEVMTGAEAGQLLLNQSMGGMDLLGPVLLGFAAVAVITSAMVIANTFAIVLSQRTRELALLRCVGATRSQVRRTVLTEALVLGAAAATVGLVVGIGVVHLAAAAVDRLDLGVEFTLRPGWPLSALLVPWVLGIGVTLAAAWWPTRRATRVAPLAALAPASAPAAVSRPGLLRILVSVALLGVGAAGLVLAAATHEVLVGVAAGFVSFAGVLVAAVFLIPRGIRALGALVPGVPARLAVGATVSNPSRAAATSAALLIGVTLITMTSVGAASAARTADAEIDANYPADVVVMPVYLPDGEPGPPAEAVSGPAAAQISRLDGVAATALLPSAWVTVDKEGSWPSEQEVYGLDPAEAGPALRSQRMIETLEPGTIGVGGYFLEFGDLAVGDLVTVTGVEGTRQARVVEVEFSGFLMPLSDLQTIDATAADRPGMLIRLDDGADVSATVGDIQEIVQGDGLWATGSAPQRAELNRALTVLVLITTGLLGVAVVIAVVGIANTLALSVLERSRENSLLRALGLTRRQLRSMLTIEGILLAVTSAVIGIALGVTYAWFGVRTLLPEGTDAVLAFPLTRLAVILAVAVAAGLLASVLPARRAARTTPAAGLAAV